MCRKGNSNMLSVNSNPTSAMAFKGKPSAKDLKKVYEAKEKARWNQIMKDSRISNEVKKILLINKTVSDLSQMNWFEKLKLFFKKPF